MYARDPLWQAASHTPAASGYSSMSRKGKAELESQNALGWREMCETRGGLWLRVQGIRPIRSAPFTTYASYELTPALFFSPTVNMLFAELTPFHRFLQSVRCTSEGFR
jgi:hypothetical protein